MPKYGVLGVCYSLSKRVYLHLPLVIPVALAAPLSSEMIADRLSPETRKTQENLLNPAPEYSTLAALDKF